MSIPDATKKYLESVRQKQSTQEIIDALQTGGLPPSKYNTVYSILARRQSQVGDIINIKSAHWTALLLSSGGYRPCGRPFINHLIGTASVLVHFGFEARLIVAALLHAAYTHAPKMRGGALTGCRSCRSATIGAGRSAVKCGATNQVSAFAR
jgi:hypothetical protein